MASKFKIGDFVRPIEHPHTPGTVMAVEVTQAMAYEYKCDFGESGGPPQYRWMKEADICDGCRFFFQVLATEDFGFGFGSLQEASAFQVWAVKTLEDKFQESGNSEAFCGSCAGLRINAWDEENQ